MRVPAYVKSIAEILRNTPSPEPLIRLAEISVRARHNRIGKLQHNQASRELLRGSHDYDLSIGGSEVQLSGQIYLNVNDHFRLFAFSRCGAAAGMLLSLNFTTEKGVDGIISLSQRLRFFEGRGKDSDAATAIRKAKVRITADIVARSGISVTDNLEVDFGLYSLAKREFVNTTPRLFLSQFFSVALLKGHIQGNKGFQFGCLPRFDDSFAWKWDSSGKITKMLKPNRRGLRGARTVPLGLRYQVLSRDRFTCSACGRTPKEGVTLQVDHIKPYSAGGLTIFSNLQTLCNLCNLGKSDQPEATLRRP